MYVSTARNKKKNCKKHKNKYSLIRNNMRRVFMGVFFKKYKDIKGCNYEFLSQARLHILGKPKAILFHISFSYLRISVAQSCSITAISRINTDRYTCYPPEENQIRALGPFRIQIYGFLPFVFCSV